MYTAVSVSDCEHIWGPTTSRAGGFGYGYITALLEYAGRRVEAIYPSDTGNDLVDDFVAIITSMAARIYGRRNAKRRAAQIQACAKRCVEQAEKV